MTTAPARRSRKTEEETRTERAAWGRTYIGEDSTMDMTLRDWGKSIARRSLLAMTFVFPACAAACHAQAVASACMPPNSTPYFGSYSPTLSSAAWLPGHSYTVSIAGAYRIGFGLGTGWGCPNVQISAFDLEVTPYGYDYGLLNSYVNLSDLRQESATLTTFTVSIAPGAPPEALYLMLNTSYSGEWFYWIPSIELPAPPTPPSPIGPPTSNSNCLTPTIANVSPVSPDVWFAGEKTPIVITGTNFTTEANSSEYCPPTPVTVSVDSGSVTLSDVIVVNSTTITATVEPADTDPAETAQVVLWGPPAGVDVDVKAAPNATTMAVNARPANMSSASSIPEGWGQAAQAPAQVVILPPPIIKRYRATVSGRTTTVMVGQPVELTTQPSTPLPAGFTVTKSTWQVDGTNILKYDGSNAGIVLTPTILDHPNITFYWLYSGSGLHVTYTYCATGPIVGEVCSPTATATATFNVNGGAGTGVSLTTSDSKEATIEQLKLCDEKGNYIKGDAGKAPYLGYGNLSGPTPQCVDIWTKLNQTIKAQDGTVGIKLTAAGAPLGGKYIFVQIVNADFSTYGYPAPNGGGPAPQPRICGPHTGLDKSYPFPGVNDPNSPTWAYDGPEIPLPGSYATAARNFYATMYLLWQPPPLANTATPSYPVPIGHKDWNFVATAFQDDPVGYPPAGNDHWDKNTTLTPSGNETMSFEPAQPTDNALYGYPLWSGIVSNECGVSQAIDFNALHSYPLWNVLPNTDDDSNNKEKQ